jgi:hypothetical protein
MDGGFSWGMFFLCGFSKEKDGELIGWIQGCWHAILQFRLINSVVSDILGHLRDPWSNLCYFSENLENLSVFFERVS